MQRLTGTVSSSDIMRGIVHECSITNITPLKEVIQHYSITGQIGIIEVYQHLLDECFSQLRVRYLPGSSKDFFNTETIIFILDWTPNDASFINIKRLFYEAFYQLYNRIIVAQDTGKKILHLHVLNIYYLLYHMFDCCMSHAIAICTSI